MMSLADDLRRASELAVQMLDSIHEARFAAQQYRSSNLPHFADRFIEALFAIENGATAFAESIGEDALLAFAAVQNAPVVLDSVAYPSVHAAIFYLASGRVSDIAFSISLQNLPALPVGEFPDPPFPSKDVFREHIAVAVDACLEAFPANSEWNHIQSCREQELAKALSQAQQAADKTDTQRTGGKNISMPKLPRDVDTRDLMSHLESSPNDPRADKEKAVDFFRGDDKKAESALRAIRRYRKALEDWKTQDSADT